MMSVYFCSSSLLKLHYFFGDVNLVCLVFCVMCEKCFRTEDRLEENLSLNNVTLLYTQRPWSPRRRVQVNPSSQHSPNHSSYVPLPYLPKEKPPKRTCTSCGCVHRLAVSQARLLTFSSSPSTRSRHVSSPHKDLSKLADFVVCIRELGVSSWAALRVVCPLSFLS